MIQKLQIRLVNLHRFQACGNVMVGYNQLFNDYGLYVQDIIATLASEVNTAIVSQIMDALLGKSIDMKDDTEAADSCTEL